MENNIIIDTDCGVDDTFCLANFLSLHRAKRCKVLGITTVCGNIPTESAYQSTNMLVKEVLKVTDVPVFRSASSEFNDTHASFFYGTDGHCGTLKKQSTRHFDCSDTSSEQFLLEQLTTRSNVTIIAIGPLTNLHRIEEISPGILSKCKDIIIMGGAIYEPGNCPKTNMASEYNFGMDGKAAQCVLRSGAKITLFPLDITHTIRFDINTLISRASQTKQKEFYKDCIEGTFKAMVFYGESKPEDRRLTIHDVHCYVYYMNPELYTVEDMYLNVEDNGRVVDAKKEDNKSCAKVAFTGVDTQQITELVLMMFN
ncbi:uncharacterized protein LOC134824120 [Bolinopsis microptera]|uniref:uncharacterized protein LOC134824120 n=1 Tax=Bolinopsis microptera TaxID=2820187 RepID=UPI00307A604F